MEFQYKTPDKTTDLAPLILSPVGTRGFPGPPEVAPSPLKRACMSGYWPPRCIGRPPLAPCERRLGPLVMSA
jgi:hypothetical protein